MVKSIRRDSRDPPKKSFKVNEIEVNDENHYRTQQIHIFFFLKIKKKKKKRINLHTEG